MRISISAALLFAAAGVAFTAGAGAQTKKPPATEFSGDFGFVAISGNTTTSSLSAGERLIRRIAAWEFRQEFGAVYGKTDGKESSNLLKASLRGDYGLTSHFALYARTAFDRNKFAGIKSRFSEGLGAVARVLATEINQLNLEAGIEPTQQENLDGTSNNFTSARAATNWKHAFSKTAYFYQALEALPNLDDNTDFRLNSETSVVAPLSTHVAMKLSYQVRFDNEPALNAAGTAPLRKSDRILSSGIQISF